MNWKGELKRLKKEMEEAEKKEEIIELKTVGCIIPRISLKDAEKLSNFNTFFKEYSSCSYVLRKWPQNLNLMYQKENLKFKNARIFTFFLMEKIGYPSEKERENYWFFDGQPELPEREILVRENKREVRRERKEWRSRMKKSFSQRTLNSKRYALVVYPSGRQFKARVIFTERYVVIEPQEENTAYFLVEKEKFYKKEVINLRETEYLRVYHTRKGNDFIKSLLR
jgi:hypothetical protein